MKILLFILFTSSIFTESTKINITQSACQFVEFEEKDFLFQTKNESDCKKINSSSLENRKNKFKPLKLKSGKYTFIVSSKNIPYEVGFWIRGKGFSRLTLPSVSGGGIFESQPKEYLIDLKPGKYLVSCPLNPTPDYEILVE